MILEGSEIILAKNDKVWNFLAEPEKLVKCLPDLKKMEIKGPDEFVAQVKIGIGFVKSDFTFKFTSTKEPPTKMSIKGRGNGPGGVVDLSIDVTLAPADKGTKMDWKADAKVGGLMASVGQRLMEGAAKKNVGQLFGCIKSQLER